ncbi:MAG: kinase [Trebouxia sp. A1-2]|nr:MAG: kinase [Trebouxia sp. A1-2]
MSPCCQALQVSIMAAIRHPNVVMFMGLCLNPVCVVTEFCVRGALSDVIEKAASDAAFAQQLPWPKRLSMALDAAKGMLQLHSHKPPILHRDLKSPNLLVDKHWRVKVTDFNLSSMLRLDADSDGVDSSAANNPRWLAPEVISVQNFSKAADVYPFGIILWELMTWQVPWDDLNPFQVATEQTSSS